MGEIVSDRVQCPPPHPPPKTPSSPPAVATNSHLFFNGNEKHEKGEKISLPKTQEVKKPGNSCRNIFTFSGMLRSFSQATTVLEDPLLSPFLGLLASALNDPVKCCGP